MEIELAGNRMVLLASGAVHWPDEAAVLVADLHLGKDQVFRRQGIPVPARVLDETLDRLDRVLEATGAGRLIVLGDLVHAPPQAGEAWPRAVADWRAGRQKVSVELVPGNHDRSLSGPLKSWGILEHCPRLEMRGLGLVHAAENPDPAPGLSGHLHPVARLRSPTESLRLPVFARRGDHLVLPAFGSFTGGIQLEAGCGWQRLALAGDRVVALDSPNGKGDGW